LYIHDYDCPKNIGIYDHFFREFWQGLKQQIHDDQHANALSMANHFAAIFDNSKSSKLSKNVNFV